MGSDGTSGDGKIRRPGQSSGFIGIGIGLAGEWILKLGRFYANRFDKAARKFQEAAARVPAPAYT